MNDKKADQASDLFPHIAANGEAMTDFYTMSTDKRQELLDAIMNVNHRADKADGAEEGLK